MVDLIFAFDCSCNIKISSAIQANKVEPHGYISGFNLVLTQQGRRETRFIGSAKYCELQ